MLFVTAKSRSCMVVRGYRARWAGLSLLVSPEVVREKVAAQRMLFGGSVGGSCEPF